MKKICCLAVLLSCCLAILLSCSGRGGKTLVTVNGKTITEGDLDYLGTVNPRLKSQIATPFGKKQIVDNLVEQELLYQAALKKGIQRDSTVKAKIDLYTKVIIAQSLIEDQIKKAAKDYYDKNKNEFEKLSLSHILVKFAETAEKGKKAEKDAVARSKETALKMANDIKKRLDGGADFATVAKESSEDAMTKNTGGDLGKVSKNEPRLESRGYGPLLEKAYTMKVAEVAGPIEAKDGYHIITVTKGVELQPYEEAEQAILFKIQNDERTKLLADLKKDNKVVYADEEKPATPPPATGAQPAKSGQPAAQATPAPAPKPAPAPTATAKPAPAPAPAVKPAPVTPAPAAPAKK